MDKSTEFYWNWLNKTLANMCGDGEIEEEEMESILDEAQLSDQYELMGTCEEYGMRIDDQF